MTSQASLPKIILRSSSDLVAWDKQQKNTFLKYGAPGDAIRQKIKHVKFTPQLDDMVLDHLDRPTRSPKYPVTNDQTPTCWLNACVMRMHSADGNATKSRTGCGEADASLAGELGSRVGRRN